MATKAIFVTAGLLLLLVGACTVQAQLSGTHAEDEALMGDAQRQLLQAKKPNSAKAPKAASGVDHFFKRLEKFAYSSAKPKRMLLSKIDTADDTAAAGLRQLLQAKKPNSAKAPKAASGVEHFFRRIEKFAFGGTKPKRMLLLADDTAAASLRQLLQAKKPNSAKAPKAASGVDHFFKRLEKFAYSSAKPKL